MPGIFRKAEVSFELESLGSPESFPHPIIAKQHTTMWILAKLLLALAGSMAHSFGVDAGREDEEFFDIVLT